MENRITNEVHNTEDRGYVLLSLGHKSFSSGMSAIVAVSRRTSGILIDYVKTAKEKACKQLGLDEKEVIVFDCIFLGGDNRVLFID